MSKESIARDRWRQLGQARYGDWCKGCGLYFTVHGQHRADCLLTPPACPECRYYPNVHGVHRADCRQREDQPAS